MVDNNKFDDNDSLIKTQTKNLKNNENLLRSFYEEVSKSPHFLLIMIKWSFYRTPLKSLTKFN